MHLYFPVDLVPERVLALLHQATTQLHDELLLKLDVVMLLPDILMLVLGIILMGFLHNVGTLLDEFDRLFNILMLILDLHLDLHLYWCLRLDEAGVLLLEGDV